jgi:hypothetical protein
MATLVRPALALCLLSIFLSCLFSDALGAVAHPHRVPSVVRGGTIFRPHCWSPPCLTGGFPFHRFATAIAFRATTPPSDEEVKQSFSTNEPTDLDSLTSGGSKGSSTITANSAHLLPDSSAAAAAAEAPDDEDKPRLTLWQGRMLILAAAAIYGTNFALVKLLGDSMTVGSAASARFTIAAVAVCLPIGLQETMHNLRSSQQQQTADDITTAMSKSIKDGDGTTVADELTPGERWPSTWLGAEVGTWYCIGYIFQALGLETVDASKVRRALRCITL